MTHYSKKDSWIVVLVLVGITGPLVLGIAFIAVGGPLRQGGLACLSIGGVTGLVVVLLTYPLYYKITNEQLIVRCGVLVNQRIDLSSIVRVQPTGNPLSAPAWSLDRLRIDYEAEGREKFTLISPTDKTAFMRELAAADEGLKWADQSLERLP